VEFESTLLSRAQPAWPADSDERGYLDRSAYTVLTRLILGGPMSINELSNALGLDVSTLNRQTAKMTRNGLARRIPDPEGGIARKFVVTDEARERVDSFRSLRVTALGEVLQGWTEHDLDQLATLLHRFNAGLEHLLGHPWPRP
jgi:DNA-binding MarR family transcriptional regulator